MVEALRGWRLRVLPAVMGCLLPAAACASQDEYAPLNELVAELLVATAVGALLGWTNAGEAARSRRDRVVAWGCEVLVVASVGVVVYGATVDTPPWWDPGLTVLFGFYMATAGGFVIGHAARLARGSARSWWLAELGAVTGVAALTVTLGWDLGGGAWALALIAGALAILSLLAASIAAFRADAATAARAHRRTLRIALVSSAVVISIVGVHVRMLGPSDLEQISVTAFPSGPWVMVSGQARWPESYEPYYLMNVQTGRWIRQGAWISADGRLAAWWPESDDEKRPRPVFVMELDSEEPRPRRLRSVRADIRGFEFLLSPAGRFLLVKESGQLVVVDIEADRVTKRFGDVSGPGRRQWRLDDGGRLRLLFTPRERWDVPSYLVEIHDEDPARGALRLVGVIEVPRDMVAAKVGFASFLGDERLRVSWRGLDQERRLTLHDSRDGRQHAVIADGDHRMPMALMLLADAQLIHPGPDGETLEVLSRDGVLEHVVRVPRASCGISFVGEESPGRIVISACDRTGRRVMLVDVDAGEVCAVASDLEPVDRAWDIDYRVGSLATRLFRGTSKGNYDELIEVDWATGARRVVLPH